MLQWFESSFCKIQHWIPTGFTGGAQGKCCIYKSSHCNILLCGFPIFPMAELNRLLPHAVRTWTFSDNLASNHHCLPMHHYLAIVIMIIYLWHHQVQKLFLTQQLIIMHDFPLMTELIGILASFAANKVKSSDRAGVNICQVWSVTFFLSFVAYYCQSQLPCLGMCCPIYHQTNDYVCGDNSLAGFNVEEGNEVGLNEGFGVSSLT